MDQSSLLLNKKQRKELRRQEKKAAIANMSNRKTGQRIMLWSVVALVIAGLIFGVTKLSGSNTKISLLTNEVVATDWVKGSDNAPLTIIEYSDFQCPKCAFYFGIIKSVLPKYNDKVRFVYRYFPLKDLHKNAELASRAAEAAGKQTKFWEMHDLLFINQSVWSNRDDARDLFYQYATDLQLNLDQFKKDIDSTVVKDYVEASYLSAVKNGLRGTPTFFANGNQVEFQPSAEAFEKLIQILLKEGN